MRLLSFCVLVTLPAVAILSSSHTVATTASATTPALYNVLQGPPASADVLGGRVVEIAESLKNGTFTLNQLEGIISFDGQTFVEPVHSLLFEKVIPKLVSEIQTNDLSNDPDLHYFFLEVLRLVPTDVAKQIKEMFLNTGNHLFLARVLEIMERNNRNGLYDGVLGSLGTTMMGYGYGLLHERHRCTYPDFLQHPQKDVNKSFEYWKGLLSSPKFGKLAESYAMSSDEFAEFLSDFACKGVRPCLDVLEGNIFSKHQIKPVWSDNDEAFETLANKICEDIRSPVEKDLSDETKSLLQELVQFYSAGSGRYSSELVSVLNLLFNSSISMMIRVRAEVMRGSAANNELSPSYESFKYLLFVRDRDILSLSDCYTEDQKFTQEQRKTIGNFVNSMLYFRVCYEFKAKVKALPFKILFTTFKNALESRLIHDDDNRVYEAVKRCFNIHHFLTHKVKTVLELHFLDMEDLSKECLQRTDRYPFLKKLAESGLE